ncbi:hypothetical protein PMAYCL1PPCAC_27910, partial [Pristionchus mayeri]
SDFSVCAKLLRSSTIEHLNFQQVITDEITASLFSIFSRITKNLSILAVQPQLADPAAFIEKLNSFSITQVYL